MSLRTARSSKHYWMQYKPCTSQKLTLLEKLRKTSLPHYQALQRVYYFDHAHYQSLQEEWNRNMLSYDKDHSSILALKKVQNEGREDNTANSGTELTERQTGWGRWAIHYKPKWTEGIFQYWQEALKKQDQVHKEATNKICGGFKLLLNKNQSLFFCSSEKKRKV